MFGKIYNSTLNQTVDFNGNLHGTLARSTLRLVGTKQYNGANTLGRIIQVEKLNGIVMNTNNATSDKAHVTSIKDFNTLSRKGLTNINPIFGQHLHETSPNLDSNDQYAQENWYIVEYINERQPDNLLLKRIN